MSVSAQLRIAIGALMLLIACVLGAAFYVPYKLNAHANETYVDDVIPLRALVQDLVLQETKQKAAVQAYLVTRDEASLEPYYDAVEEANRDIRAIQEEHAPRHPSLDRLLRRAVPQIADLQGVFIASTAPANTGAPAPRIAEVNRAFDRFNTTASQMIRETERFVAEAEAEQRSTYRQLLIVLGTLAGVALVLGSLLLLRTPRRIGELYAAEARSRREAEARADAARALEHVTDGVVLADAEGRMRLWNPAATKLLNLPGRDGALGRKISEFLPGWEAIVQRTAPTVGGGPVVVPVEMSSDERWLSVTSASFHEGTVLAIRDVTEERALEQMRSEFLATASHELRTPMTAVYGAARTLLQRGPELEPERRQSFVEMIVAEAERLSRIVDDILLASRIEAGRVDVALERCRAQDLAQSVLESSRVAAPPNISLRLEAPDDLPPIAVDPHRLRQVLGNILDNAIKYSPEGGEILMAVSGNGDRVRFEVRDEGLGFPADERERIFERFHRLDPDQTRGIGGTGLGLYISRELVERMRGRIWADSEPGRGATFVVEVPFAEDMGSEVFLHFGPRKRQGQRRPTG